MAVKYHLKANGDPAACDADIKPCPKGDAPHFSTKEEARAYYEQLNENGLIPSSMSKKFVKERLKQNSPNSPFKKFAKVAGGVLVAVIAINAISNISDENSSANAALDELPDDSISTFDETPEILTLPELDETENNQYVEEGKEIFEKGKDAVAGGVGAASNWVKNNETIQDGVSKAKDWFNNNETVQDGIDSVKNWWNDLSSDDTILTVDNDGSIMWGNKSLTPTESEVETAKATLKNLKVAPKNVVSDYDREGIFGTQGDSIRGQIEHRDLEDATFNSRDRAVSGTLKDPYTGKTLTFKDGETRPYDLEHVVALKEVERSEDKANPLTAQQKIDIANDPNNLILVDSSANRSKSDKNANDWVPSYEPSQCRFAIETISVKNDYKLNVDKGEKQVLENILNTRCEAK